MKRWTHEEEAKPNDVVRIEVCAAQVVFIAADLVATSAELTSEEMQRIWAEAGREVRKVINDAMEQHKLVYDKMRS